jgi:hypothetical protein
VIGTLVHSVIEDATRRGVTAISDPAAALAERCNAWDVEPDGGHRWPQLVPLRRYLVDERRRDALATIAAGLGHIGRGGLSPAGKTGTGWGPPKLDPHIAGRWPEFPIEDQGLGLRGCIDLLISNGVGQLMVIDYKTGFNQEADDQQDKRAVYHRQVQIYLFMLSRIHPDASLGGRLIGSHGEDVVPWDEAIAVQIAEHLELFGKTLSQTNAAQASPSTSSCMFCPIRHRCPSFRPWVEANRADVGPEFLAGNVWGVLQQPPRTGMHQASLTMRDAAGSLIVVNGLIPREGYSMLVQGSPISAYGLKPERDTEGKIKPNRLWERRATGRTLCASALIFSGHPPAV